MGSTDLTMTEQVTAIVPAIPDFARIVPEIERAMKQTVAPEASVILSDISKIETWQSNVTINTRFLSTKSEVSVFLFPGGDAEGQRKWRYVSFGTPPHKIPKTPKPVGQSLKFKWGGPGSYRPKTYPFAGPPRLGGGQTGTYRYFKQVNHPGIEPRYFEKRTKVQYEPRFIAVMDTAFERGVNAASRAAR